VFVWGLIIAMLVIVSIEAHAKFSYDATLAAISDAHDKAEGEGKDLGVAEMEKLVSGIPLVKRTQSPVEGGVADETREYRWWSLFKPYSITVSLAEVDKNAGLVVTQIATAAAPDAEPLPATADNTPSGDGPPAPQRDSNLPPIGPGASGGHGGPAGGHRGPGGPAPSSGGGQTVMSFAILDANQDGQLTSDELPASLASNMDRLDVNSDGWLSEEELEGRPDDGGRPELEEVNEGDETDEAETPVEDESQDESSDEAENDPEEEVTEDAATDTEGDSTTDATTEAADAPTDETEP
jgi:hypothetical protein